jgi:hypothetical protein
LQTARRRTKELAFNANIPSSRPMAMKLQKILIQILTVLYALENIVAKLIFVVETTFAGIPKFEKHG